MSEFKLPTSKYVRCTNGKIYQNTWGNDELDCPMILLHRENVVKESDKFEDLCDKFLLVDENEYEEPINRELFGDRFSAMYGELKFRISEGSDPSKMGLYAMVMRKGAYGEPILHSVAKINDYGEWDYYEIH